MRRQYPNPCGLGYCLRIGADCYSRHYEWGIHLANEAKSTLGMGALLVRIHDCGGCGCANWTSHVHHPRALVHLFLHTDQVTLGPRRSEEHTSELQSHHDLVCRLLLEK